MLTYNFQGTHILGTSRGHLWDSSVFLSSLLCCRRLVILFTVEKVSRLKSVFSLLLVFICMYIKHGPSVKFRIPCMYNVCLHVFAT